jgi:hypothetical protein
MSEIDILDFFYDQLRATGQTRHTLFISLDDAATEKISLKLGVEIPLTTVHHFADICIANEWLERTTADLEYRYLSLTEAGLSVAISYQYQK